MLVGTLIDGVMTYWAAPYVPAVERHDDCSCKTKGHTAFADGKSLAEVKFTDPFGAPVYPPLGWFRPPAADEPIDGVQIHEDGRMSGYWWTKGTCLLDRSSECWTPQPSPTGYAAFHQGTTFAIDDNGNVVKVKTGAIGMDLPHANPFLDPSAAAEHYANTGLQRCYAVLGDNEHGGWMAGAVVPEATHGEVARMRRSGTSGDWRYFPRLTGKGGAAGWDSLGPIFVTRPGLPIDRTHIPQARAAAVGDATGLIAVFGGFGRPWATVRASAGKEAFVASDTATKAPEAPTGRSAAETAVLEAYVSHGADGGWDDLDASVAKVERYAVTNGVALWQVSDGWGEWFFAGNDKGVVWVAQTMADVGAYHADDKVLKLTKDEVKAMGLGDAAWRKAIIEAVNAKPPRGAGKYKTGETLDTIDESSAMADETGPTAMEPVQAATRAAVAAVRARTAAVIDEAAVKAAWDAHLVEFNFEPDAGVAPPTIATFGTGLWEVKNDRGMWFFGEAGEEVRWLAQVMLDMSAVTLAPGMPELSDKVAAKAWDEPTWQQWITENAGAVLQAGATEEAAMAGTKTAADPTVDPNALPVDMNAPPAGTGSDVTVGCTVTVDGKDGEFVVVAIGTMEDGGGVFATLDDGSIVDVAKCTVTKPATAAVDAAAELRDASSKVSKARTAADPLLVTDQPMPDAGGISIDSKLDAIMATLGSMQDTLNNLAGQAPAETPPPPAAPAAADEMSELAAAIAAEDAEELEAIAAAVSLDDELEDLASAL